MRAEEAKGGEMMVPKYPEQAVGHGACPEPAWRDKLTESGGEEGHSGRGRSVGKGTEA